MSSLASHPAKLPAWAHRLWRCLGRWAAAAALAAGAVGTTQAEPLPPAAVNADEAKAALLHRISGFVEWPATSFATVDAPIIVGVVGSQSVLRELAQVVAGRLVQGRPLQVVELAEPRQVGKVHMLLIGKGAWKRAPEWIAGAKGNAVLVTTDMPQGLERGAALVFLETDARLRFEASVPAAEAAGVKLSSRLLALAERVVRAP